MRGGLGGCCARSGCTLPGQSSCAARFRSADLPASHLQPTLRCRAPSSAPCAAATFSYAPRTMPPATACWCSGLASLCARCGTHAPSRARSRRTSSCRQADASCAYTSLEFRRMRLRWRHSSCTILAAGSNMPWRSCVHPAGSAGSWRCGMVTFWLAGMTWKGSAAGDRRAHHAAPRCVQAVMSASGKRFIIDKQSDPVEFLSWLINTLHMDLTGGKRKKRSGERADCPRGRWHGHVNSVELPRPVHFPHTLVHTGTQRARFPQLTSLLQQAVACLAWLACRHRHVHDNACLLQAVPAPAPPCPQSSRTACRASWR